MRNQRYPVQRLLAGSVLALVAWLLLCLPISLAQANVLQPGAAIEHTESLRSGYRETLQALKPQLIETLNLTAESIERYAHCDRNLDTGTPTEVHAQCTIEAGIESLQALRSLEALMHDYRASFENALDEQRASRALMDDEYSALHADLDTREKVMIDYRLIVPPLLEQLEADVDMTVEKEGDIMKLIADTNSEQRKIAIVSSELRAMEKAMQIFDRVINHSERLVLNFDVEATVLSNYAEEYELRVDSLRRTGTHALALKDYEVILKDVMGYAAEARGVLSWIEDVAPSLSVVSLESTVADLPDLHTTRASLIDGLRALMPDNAGKPIQ